MNVTWIGWAATAVFTASYFARRERVLRRVQMAGALLWLSYGIAIEALPVVVANGLLLVAAAWTTRRGAASSPASQ